MIEAPSAFSPDFFAFRCLQAYRASGAAAAGDRDGHSFVDSGGVRITWKALHNGRDAIGACEVAAVNRLLAG
jgi:hypothetical protein